MPNQNEINQLAEDLYEYAYNEDVTYENHVSAIYDATRESDFWDERKIYNFDTTQIEDEKEAVFMEELAYKFAQNEANRSEKGEKVITPVKLNGNFIEATSLASHKELYSNKVFEDDKFGIFLVGDEKELIDTNFKTDIYTKNEREDNLNEEAKTQANRLVFIIKGDKDVSKFDAFNLTEYETSNVSVLILENNDATEKEKEMLNNLKEELEMRSIYAVSSLEELNEELNYQIETYYSEKMFNAVRDADAEKTASLIKNGYVMNEIQKEGLESYLTDDFKMDVMSNFSPEEKTDLLLSKEGKKSFEIFKPKSFSNHKQTEMDI